MEPEYIVTLYNVRNCEVVKNPLEDGKKNKIFRVHVTYTLIMARPVS